MTSAKLQIPNSKQASTNQIPSTKRTFDLESRTLEFAKRVIHLCREVNHNTISRELVSQLIRASGSVGANYCEANEALSKKDFGHRIRIARKEAKEAHYWLELLGEAQPELNDSVQTLEREAVELRKILSSIAQKADS